MRDTVHAAPALPGTTISAKAATRKCSRIAAAQAEVDAGALAHPAPWPGYRGAAGERREREIGIARPSPKPAPLPARASGSATARLTPARARRRTESDEGREADAEEHSG